MSSVNFFSDLHTRWNQLDSDGRTSAKLVISAVITAIVFSAIALSIHFAAQGNPIAGWTMDALLLVTALPAGMISVGGQLLAAALIRPFRNCIIQLGEEERHAVERHNQDPNSPIPLKFRILKCIFTGRWDRQLTPEEKQEEEREHEQMCRELYEEYRTFKQEKADKGQND